MAKNNNICSENKRLFLISAFCLALAGTLAPVCAQTDTTAVLIAQVKDVDTDAGLPYVTLVLRRPGALPQVHITDLHGRVELEHLAPGRVSVQARHSGYASSDTTFALQEGLIAQVRLQLSSKPILLSEEVPIQALSATDLISRLIASSRFEYLHTHYPDIPAYSLDAFSYQQAINRRTEKLEGGLHYTIRGYYHTPDSLAQQVTGVRSWGKWRLSISPGLTEAPARAYLDDKPFEITPHPLALNALDHYHYELISTVQVGDLLVSRLGISPRHGQKPGLIGDIWIARDDFSLVGYDLRLNFPALMLLRNIEHWQIYQQSTRYLNRYWLPAKQEWHIETRDWIVRATTSCYRYNLNPDLPPKIFDGPEVYILPEATQRDSAFWAQHTASQDTAHIQAQNKLLKGDLPAAWQSLGLSPTGQ